MKNKECFFSSFLFLTSALLAYKYKYYEYAFSFLFLVITSLIHHYYFNTFTRNLDRIAILIVSYYSILIFYNKNKDKDNKIEPAHNLFFVLSFIFITFIFIYGFFAKKYSFDKNHRTACLWHSLLHSIACVALNILILI